jgi:hypothetical protein
MTASQHHVFSTNAHGKVPSAFAVLKVNFSFCFSQKSLRLKVYSLGTGTQEGTHINPNKGMTKRKKALEKGKILVLEVWYFLSAWCVTHKRTQEIMVCSLWIHFSVAIYVYPPSSTAVSWVPWSIRCTSGICSRVYGLE